MNPFIVLNANGFHFWLLVQLSCTVRTVRTVPLLIFNSTPFFRCWCYYYCCCYWCCYCSLYCTLSIICAIRFHSLSYVWRTSNSRIGRSRVFVSVLLLTNQVTFVVVFFLSLVFVFSRGEVAFRYFLTVISKQKTFLCIFGLFYLCFFVLFHSIYLSLFFVFILRC